MGGGDGKVGLWVLTVCVHWKLIKPQNFLQEKMLLKRQYGRIRETRPVASNG